LKKLLEKISRKTGLTVTEINTFLFVIIVFIFGATARYFKVKISQKPRRIFDYSFEDSLFKALNKNKIIESGSLKKKENLVDSEVELSDFSKRKKVYNNKNNSTSERSLININTANSETLTNLPGIGSKTADKIIELREKKGKFKKFNELLEVKGIGQKKLQTIIKFIYIENQKNS
jgi:competence ComEA-like helix-hairpin-helix protein